MPRGVEKINFPLKMEEVFPLRMRHLLMEKLLDWQRCSAREGGKQLKRFKPW